MKYLNLGHKRSIKFKMVTWLIIVNVIVSTVGIILFNVSHKFLDYFALKPNNIFIRFSELLENKSHPFFTTKAGASFLLKFPAMPFFVELIVMMLLPLESLQGTVIMPSWLPALILSIKPGMAETALSSLFTLMPARMVGTFSPTILPLQESLRTARKKAPLVNALSSKYLSIALNHGFEFL